MALELMMRVWVACNGGPKRPDNRKILQSPAKTAAILVDRQTHSCFAWCGIYININVNSNIRIQRYVLVVT